MIIGDLTTLHIGDYIKIQWANAEKNQAVQWNDRGNYFTLLKWI